MPYRNWIRLILINFFIVALAGLVMRYKIAWSLPWINQKHLMHAHSHFAFSGWVSAALFLMMSWLLYPDGPPKVVRLLFIALIVASYGMLFTFPFMGYDGPSIFFSALTVLIGYAYLGLMWKPLATLGEAGNWIRIALLANAISSLGTYALAWLMQQPGISQKWYVGAVYFFLHFQYNGWFFFAIVGLFIHFMASQHAADLSLWRRARIWMTAALLPALFLSALWLELPLPLYLMACAAALIQMAGLWYMVKAIPFKSLQLKRGAGLLWGTALAALLIKTVLQLLSCIPELSHYAFGYRPLVIAYLHLVLLGMVSLFIVGYFVQAGWIRYSRGLKLLWLTVVLNELILIIQGLSAIGYIAVPHVNIMLFWNSVLLLLSVAWLFQTKDSFLTSNKTG